MKKDLTLTQEDFDSLLGWLSSDRDEAGVLYEKIREGLIRFFRFRGCDDPSTLADETINRVALKVNTFDSAKDVKTITYFYGFASNVFFRVFADEQKTGSFTGCGRFADGAKSARGGRHARRGVRLSGKMSDKIAA